MTHTTYGPDCICRQGPPVHEDDSYGDCTVCREWVPHTDDDHVHVRFPCAVAKLAESEAALERMGGWLADEQDKCSRLRLQARVARQALLSIAALDYRGNEPPEQRIARVALAAMGGTE